MGVVNELEVINCAHEPIFLSSCDLFYDLKRLRVRTLVKIYNTRKIAFSLIHSLHSDSTVRHRLTGDSTVRHRLTGDSTVRHRLTGDSTVRHRLTGDSTVRHRLTGSHSVTPINGFAFKSNCN